MNKLDLSKISIDIRSQQQPETIINEYKVFFKSHLKNIHNRQSILTYLYELCIRFQNATPKELFTPDTERKKLEIDTDIFLSKYFNKEIIDLYNKKIPTPKRKPTNPDDNFWKILFEGLSQSFNLLDEKYKEEFSYKTNFLIFLNNCLFNYGLHPNILKRDPKIYKRYNFLVEHYFKSPKIKQIEFKTLISPSHLQNEYLTPYEKKVPIKFKGKLLPFKSIYCIKITSTLLLDDEIELFANKNNFEWKSTTKDYMSFINYCNDETEDLLVNPFLIDDDIINNQNIYFIHPTRIKELKQVKNKKFDLTKLIQLCNELNNASASNNLFSSSLLARAIIDHIPPIFNFNSFTQVANNYLGGTKSFKKSMLILDNSLRNIADNNIHSQIRQKEVLPTSIQVEFIRELDLLLSEIVRILK